MDNFEKPGASRLFEGYIRRQLALFIYRMYPHYMTLNMTLKYCAPEVGGFSIIAVCRGRRIATYFGNL